MNALMLGRKLTRPLDDAAESFSTRVENGERVRVRPRTSNDAAA